MKPLVARSVLAVGVAAVLALAAGVPVLAQYGPMAYDGPFYWLSDNRAFEGFRWFPAPRRGWSESGAPWSAATSFPPRLWEFQVAGAPPNDPCYQVPFRWLDPNGGPFGLQVNQYLGEWWEGTTYLSHPNPPSGWIEDMFGYFDFDPRADRAQVGDNGLPAGFVGQVDGTRGACAAKIMAMMRGSGDPWIPHNTDDPSGEPCMAWPDIYVVRMNLEPRCEPDLSLPDAYTALFYSYFDPWPYPLLPDGQAVPVLFPDDYPAGDSGALGRLWVRRADVGMKQWVNNGAGPYAANFPASVVFEGAGGGGDPAVVGGARPDYLDYHEWRLDPSLSAADRRASPRNVLKTVDSSGNVVADFVTIRDQMTGVDDCLALDLASYESTLDIDWRCDRVNSFGLARRSLQTEERYSDVGAASPAEVAAMLTSATVPGAVGNRQPEPPGGNFWLEYDDFNIRCHGGFYSAWDLPAMAQASVLAWERYFATVWADYLAVQADYDAGRASWDERDAAYALAWEVRGMWEGWVVIHAYRVDVHPEMLMAVINAGYQPGGSGAAAFLEVDFDGGGCAGQQVSLQPFRRVGGNTDVAPPNAGAITDEMALTSWSELGGSDRFTAAQQDAGLRHYTDRSKVRVQVGAASHYVRDNSMRAGSDFPVGPTHWNGVDVDVSPNFFMPLACGKPQENVFAPDVVNMPAVGFWNAAGEWEQILDADDPRRRGLTVDGGEAFDRRTFASYTECADSAFGGGDCYASDEMKDRVEAYNPGGVQTLTARALAEHRDAVDSGVDQGVYIADRLQNFDPDGHREALFSVNETVSSGDLDSSGELIVHDEVDMYAGEIGEPTSYAVQTLTAPHTLLYAYNPDRTGLDNLDHLSNWTRHEFAFREYYWGVAPGTASHAPPGTIAETDREWMTRSGPVRLSAAMGYARGAGVGSCTVCSENGCDDSVVEEFVGERFTSSVTLGTAVCLVGPTPLPRPAHSCPTVANTR